MHIKMPVKTIVIRPEEKLDTDKMRIGIEKVFEKMHKLEKQNQETNRISQETLQTRINK